MLQLGDGVHAWVRAGAQVDGDTQAAEVYQGSSTDSLVILSF